MIVGAGPVGLLLANLLGARGVATLVCERRAGPWRGSMAIGITPPSLEILRPLGLDTAFRDAGVPVRHAEVHEAGTPLGRLDFAGIPSPYPFFLSIPQERTVGILRDNLRRFPSVRVREGLEFETLTPLADGVATTWRHLDTQIVCTSRSRLLVGCDGHRSRVRGAARIPSREHVYPQRFVMGDFLDRSGLGDEARLFFGPEASVESFPLPEGWRRWILRVDDPEATAGHLVTQVRRLTGHDLSGCPMRFVSRFGARRMVVDRYARGRVLLAGDAAHVMSSIGGQGMNTGFADAEMLAEILPRIVEEPARLPALSTAYDRIRRKAFESAATRAEWGMWLGTLRGRAASTFRRLLIRHVLFGPALRGRLAPHFAMLTIPFRNLHHVPPSRLAIA